MAKEGMSDFEQVKKWAAQGRLASMEWAIILSYNEGLHGERMFIK